MSNSVATNSYFDNLVGREINGSYRIESKIGEGGMGAVFKAVNLKDNSVVAIKIISPMLGTNPRFMKRFQREAKVGVVLSHPNIIKVHEYGETEDKLLFMTMEYISGESLRAYLTKTGPLPLARALELLGPLCEALETAHNRNLLHRDLKPENIMIAKEGDGKECVKLADFGLVKLMEPDGEITKGSNLTEVGEVFGTPHFMSPEQVLGQPIAATADIYSLGVILFQMLTGKVPVEVEGNDVRKLLITKVSQDVPPPSKTYPFLHSAVDKVFAKVLARDAADRYQTAGQFLRAFEEAVKEADHAFSQPTVVGMSNDFLKDIPKNAAATPAAPVKDKQPDKAPAKAVEKVPEKAPVAMAAPPSHSAFSGSVLYLIIGVVVLAIILALVIFIK
jgi:eukaryotic-like serine/threonine-protein kinase